MRKTIIRQALLAAVLIAAAGCAKVEDPSEYPGDSGIFATVERAVSDGTLSRSAFASDMSFVWTAGDRIDMAVSGGSGISFAPFKLAEGAGASEGRFVGSVADGCEPVGRAAYPSGLALSLSGDALKINLPESYDYTQYDNGTFGVVDGGAVNSAGMPMLATMGEGKLRFRHLGGYFCFEVSDIPAGSCRFEFVARSRRITGTFEVDLAADDPVYRTSASSSANVVNINFKAASASSSRRLFYVPVPVGDYDYEWNIYDAGGRLMAFGESGASVRISRAYLKGVRVQCSAVSAGSAVAGWYELPAVADGDASLHYASHSFSLNGKKMRNYTVCYSAEHHCPVWVAAPRHSCYTGSTGRSDAYSQDPDIPSGIQYSSRNTGGGCNKGHMLGSAERTCCSEANRQVFYYTNIAPQLSSGFNTGGGGWNLLEDWVDGQVCRDTLYEVIGCHFDRYTDGYGNTVSPQVISFGSRNDVDMPTMFYYILLRTKSGSAGKALKDCRADELKCAAFVRSHTNALKGQKPSAREMMSVSDLEKITGFTYFANVPQAPKASFSASDWGF